LTISSYLPIAIVNGRGDRVGKVQFWESQKPCGWTLTLDWIIWHTVVRHSSTSIYVYQMSSKSEKLFVDGRTDGRMYLLTDISPSNVIRST